MKCKLITGADARFTRGSAAWSKPNHIFAKSNLIEQDMVAKNMNTLFQSLTIGTFSLLIVAGCQSTGDKPETADATDIAEEVVQEVESSEMPAEYPIPTPVELAKTLNEAGASYILGITNSVDSVGNYVSATSQALNLGVYGADLSYSAMYNKSQESMDFYHASKGLSDQLNIVGTDNHEDLAKKIEDNIESAEELHGILTNSFQNTYLTLVQSGQGETAALILAGGVVEGLHLSIELATLSPNNTKIVDAIAGQRGTVNGLLQVMEKLPLNDETIQGVTRGLKVIGAILDKGAESEGGLTPENLSKLSSQVSKMRGGIVELS